MRPLLFNSLRCLACLLALLPALALAQPEAPEPPCPPAIPAAPVAVVGIAMQPAPAVDGYTAKHVLPIPSAPAIPVQTSPANTDRLECTEEVEAAAYGSEKHKTFEKIYKVNKSDVLNIENKFGRVHVNTWDRNEIQVKVDIICRASSEKNAQELLNKINIADSRSGNTISVQTEMASFRNNDGNRSIEINYTISMPEDNALTVKNSFGDVYLADMKGKVNLTVRYGTFKVGNLSNASNSIKATYCDSSPNTIGYLNKGNVDLAYSNLNLSNTNGVNGTSKYSDLKIGNLSEALEMDVKYGTFRVDNVKKNFKNISVNAGYTPIQLHFEDDSAFDFDVNVQYAEFKVDRSLVKFTTMEKGLTSAEYKGKYGSSTSKGSINITSTYEDVKFTR